MKVAEIQKTNNQESGTKPSNFLGITRKDSVRDRKVSIDVSFAP